MANGKTILIVDDDPGARQPFQFVLAPGGAEALAIASSQPVHLLVTDLMMDGMDGFELTQALHRMPAYATLPVIMLTARWQTEYRGEAGNENVIAMMTKPFSPIELLAKVKLLLKL
jgi:DNA-binding response OmpR family regulator